MKVNPCQKGPSQLDCEGQQVIYADTGAQGSDEGEALWGFDSLMKAEASS